MSRHRIIFYSSLKSQPFTSLECFENDKKNIVITIKGLNGEESICLYLTTAIKFSKTLRAEIAKIKEGGKNV